MRWAALLLFLAATTLAMAAVTEPAPRYTFVTTAAGALRLDTRSGEVALCGGATGSLACAAVPELRGAAIGPDGDADSDPGRIAALERRVAVLQDAAEDGCAPRSASMERVAALAEGVMARLLHMVREVKRGLQGED